MGDAESIGTISHDEVLEAAKAEPQVRSFNKELDFGLLITEVISNYRIKNTGYERFKILHRSYQRSLPLHQER
jgi:hypothetical protein